MPSSASLPSAEPSLGPHELGRRTRLFAVALVAHLRVHWLSYLAICVCWFMFESNYRIGFNETPSLPQSVFLIHRNAPVEKGQFVAFRARPGSPLNPNTIFTKVVAGTGGDVISVYGRVVFVNGVAVGYAKEHSLKGEPLDPVAPVRLGPGQMFVLGLHRDSLDSRYTLMSVVDRSQVVGRAYPVW